MKFAIIAAGEGSRLAQEGVEEPKPLVSVCDQPMIERLMRIFVDCGASEIVVIINEQSTSVHRYLKKLDLPVPLKIIVKTVSRWKGFEGCCRQYTGISSMCRMPPTPSP